MKGLGSSDEYVDELSIEDLAELEFEEPFIEEEKSLEDFLEEFDKMASSYRICGSDKKEMKDLIRCRYNTRKLRNVSGIPYFNMLIKSNDEERALEFTGKCAEILNEISGDGVYFISEKDLYTDGELNPDAEDKTISKWVSNMKRVFSTYTCVCVHDCIDRPLIFADAPSSTERRKNQNQVRNYNKAWETFADLSRKNPKCSLLVVMEGDVYNRSFRHNTDISEGICKHHVTVPDMTVDEMVSVLMNDFKFYEKTPGFKERLKEYIKTEYPKSGLKRKVFLNDLKNAILSEFYTRTETAGNIFEEEMVPEISGHVLTPEEVLKKAEALIGLDEVKKAFREMYTRILADVNGDGCYHMFFVGNPGTGKTTFMRLCGELLYSMGIIKKNKVVETRPSDFQSEWKGTTATKALEKIKEAYDGILGVDEFEEFNTKDDEYKKTALQTIMAEMENNRDRLVVIFAGYEDKLDEFKKMNPGIESRVRYTFKFADYTVPQLREIFGGFAREAGFTLADDTEDLLDRIICARKSSEFFGNGRDMRALWDEVLTAWSVERYEMRKAGADIEPDRVITGRNLEAVMPDKTDSQIKELVGLKNLKAKIADYEYYVKYVKAMKDRGIDVPSHSRHMVFSGNPGTGKTTVARLIAQDLYSIGALDTNKCVVVTIADFVKDNKPEENTREIVKKAKGGILFMDEAYSIAEHYYGPAITETMLTEMEDHKDDTIFIFAGYTDNMKRFLDANPGLESRIGYNFEFEDYTVDELYQIFKNKMKRSGYVLKAGVEKAVKELAEYFMDRDHFGNGRFMDKVIEEVLQKRSRRSYNDDDILVIKRQDVPTVDEFKKTMFGGSGMYDPAKKSEESVRRTAVHELGHTLLMLATDPEAVPESVSIRSRSGSYGRMSYGKDYNPICTEQWCRDHIAILLAGRNAERVFF